MKLTKGMKDGVLWLIAVGSALILLTGFAIGLDKQVETNSASIETNADNTRMLIELHLKSDDRDKEINAILETVTGDMGYAPQGQ